jgi:hypothetical protein
MKHCGIPLFLLSGWFQWLRETPDEEFSQIIDNDVRALLFHFFRVALPVYTDHESESPLSAGFDTRDRVLDNHGALRRCLKHPRRFQEGIGGRLTGEVVFDEDVAIDTCIEKVADLCGLQDRLAILT